MTLSSPSCYPVSRHIPRATRPIVLPTSLLCWSNSLIVFTPPEGDYTRPHGCALNPKGEWPYCSQGVHDESVSATKTRVRGELPPRPRLPLYLSLLDTRCMLFDQPSSHNLGESFANYSFEPRRGQSGSTPRVRFPKAPTNRQNRTSVT